ncbi:MAG: HDOD domain-containing protein [Polyangiaceae bacterium]
MADSDPVLVVEDDSSFREALRRWLEALGYASLFVESAEEAAVVFPKQELQAVLLDLNLPGRSGHVFLRQLRGVGASTPSIVMSGAARMEDVILALRQGAADFICKPFGIDELSAALDRVTKRDGVREPKPRVDVVPAVAAIQHADAEPLPVKAPPSKLRRLLDHVRTGVVSLPVLDTQIARITRLLSAAEVDAEELHALVESDANFSATLLRSANSAYYSRGNPVKTTREAFTRLGSRSALNVITGVALQARLRVRGPLAQTARKQWINTLATSRFCAELAKLLRRTDAERLQLLGLMHNVGEPLFIHLASELDLGVGPEGVLEELPGIHEAAGLALVRAWKMPADICRIVGSHHAPASGQDFDRENDRFIVLASWQLAIQCGFSYLDGQQAEPGDALAELGLTEAALAPFCTGAREWTFD